MESSTTPRVVGESADTHSGVIRWEVEKVSELTSNRIYSPTIEVARMPWKLYVFKYVSNNTHYFALGISSMISDSNIWSVVFDGKCTLFNEDSAKNRMKQLKKTITSAIFGTGFYEFLKWEKIINQENGFIKNDKISVEVQFTLSNIMGIRSVFVYMCKLQLFLFIITPRIDFTNKDDPRHDIALVIEGEKIYVSKQILAFHSPVFNTMFYGEFAEKNKIEIEPKEIDRKEFVELLNVIYPVCAKITSSNAEYLLKLGDRFQMNVVIDQVEQFLVGSTDHTIPAKLKLADQYRLFKLEDYCLGSFKTAQDIAKLKTTEEFKVLSHRSKSALLDKVVKLIV